MCVCVRDLFPEGDGGANWMCVSSSCRLVPRLNEEEGGASKLGTAFICFLTSDTMGLAIILHHFDGMHLSLNLSPNKPFSPSTAFATVTKTTTIIKLFKTKKSIFSG